MDRKYIFVTGGVVSGLGKGIACASIGALLKECGLKVAIQKCDPYLNIDPGTMNPFQHGEVFVTRDGGETDLDLGHYERFLDDFTEKFSNQTTGQVYTTVCEKERQGDYQGQTVQIVPHITNEIQRRIVMLGKNTEADIVLCEVGGTIGDMESAPFLEAIRQMQKKCGRENVCYIHLTLVPYIDSSGEIKTKPTQHSVRELKSIGINPDILICRTKNELSEEHLEKISLYCDVEKEDIIQGHDVDNVYKIPYGFSRQNIHKRILKRLGIEIDLSEFQTKWKYFDNLKPKKKVKIAVIGKYVECDDAYKSIDESLKHAGWANDAEVEIEKIDSSSLEGQPLDDVRSTLSRFNGVLVPGGFGPRGFEGKIIAANCARENNIPYLGICYGMQAAAIAGARSLCGLHDANTTECNSNTKNPIVDLMEEQKSVIFGGTMRLGDYDCDICQSSGLAYKLYGGDRSDIKIKERHRHRYEFNNYYREKIENVGFLFSGVNPDSDLVEIIEYVENDFYVAVQFHPEFNSRPFKPHPLFNGFIKAATNEQY